jgi:putative resolvase
LLSGTVCELILTYKDRLLRFGSELVFFICKRLGVTVTILDSPAEKTMEETFAEDVIAILTVFSAKLYGARSHKKIKPPIVA